ncbi:MAG: tetratricopeptide repeat protein [Candidatus Gastranaerophilales bacterium]|nr:tetratricopeptide repeat protein [Candidatus Gastranaerophilales bacterium]
MKKSSLLKKVIIISTLAIFSISFNADIQKSMAQDLTPVSYRQQNLASINGKIDTYTSLLSQNSADQNSRNSLAVAYIDRGNYYFDNAISLANAANDYRKAIYYLKYDEITSPQSILNENINIAKDNLRKVFLQQKVSLDPKSRLKIAKSLRGQGSFKEAIVEFNEALANVSQKLESYESLGDIMRVLQKDNIAIEYYTNALSIDPQNALLHLKLARALNKTENFDSAIKEYNLALESGENNAEIISALENIWTAKIVENPQDAVAHMNLGVILQKKKDFNGALSQYKASELIDPASVNLRLNIGTLFQAKGNLDMAIKAYDSILQLYPTHTLTHYYRGTALRQLGNNKGAVDEFLIVLKIDPNYTAARKAVFDTAKNSPNADERLAILSDFAKLNPTDALAQYNMAYELHSIKKIDEALSYYQKAVSVDPKLIDAYLNIASIYRGKSQYSEAEATLQNSLTINPDNQKIKKMLADVNEDSMMSIYQQAIDKYNKQDYKGAIEDYQKIISTQKPNADVYLNLGSAYQADNNYEEAIDSYKKALAMDNNNSDALYYLGSAYYTNKSYAKALEYYQKALIISPDDKNIITSINDTKSAIAESKLEKGLNEFNSKKYLLALQTFTDAIKINPNNGYAYYYRALVYDALKNYKMAINNYKVSIEKSQDINAAYYSLGIDYDILKNRIEAKKAYEKFIDNSKDNNDEYVKYAKQRVKNL